MVVFGFLLLWVVFRFFGVRYQVQTPPLMQSSPAYTSNNDISQSDLENEIAAHLSSGRQAVGKLNQRIAYLQSQPDRYGPTPGSHSYYSGHADSQSAIDRLHAAVIRADAIFLGIQGTQRDVQLQGTKQRGRAEVESDRQFRRNARANLWSWTRQLDAILREADMNAP